MLTVALVAVLATGAGVVLERRVAWAQRLAGGALTTMLYVLVPFVSFTAFAHLHLSVGGGVGLLAAYLGLGLAGTAAWAFGRRVAVDRSTHGAMIVTVIISNTGNLGYPMTVAILGASVLPHIVAYDQLVNGPIVFTAGFAVGAAFGSGERGLLRERVRLFLTRNPPLAGAALGLIVPASFAPPVLVSAAHAIVGALLVVGFLTVGIYLAAERREDEARLLELPDRRVGIALGCRFLINPVLLGGLYVAGVDIPVAYLLASLMPTGINSLLVGHAYGLNQRLIATTIVWSTLLVLLVGLTISVL